MYVSDFSVFVLQQTILLQGTSFCSPRLTQINSVNQNLDGERENVKGGKLDIQFGARIVKSMFYALIPSTIFSLTRLKHCVNNICSHQI